MTDSVVRLELCREVESEAQSAALFDGLFQFSSNREALVTRLAFDIALHKRCKPAKLRGFFTSMSNWIRCNIWPVESWLKIPSSPGCYAIYCDGRLVYIGQSQDLWKRLHSYDINYGFSNGTIYTPWGKCSDAYVKIRPSKRYGDWAMIELRMIRRIQPPLNCVGSIRKRKRGFSFDPYKPVLEQCGG